MAVPWNPASLFRSAQSALERRVQTNREEMGLQQSTFFVRSIIWILLGTTGAAFTWLALAQTDEVVVATGTLEPIGKVKVVQMPVGGVLSEMLVKDGERVNKGQTLLRLDNEATVDRQASLRSSIEAKQQELKLKQEERSRYLSLNSTERQVLSRRLVLETEILDRLSSLQQSGGVAELQFLQQRNTVREVQGELEKLAAERLRQLSIIDQSSQQLHADLSDLKSRLAELTVNIRYQDIKSPADGIVFDLKPKGSGFVAQTSEPVLKIVPFADLQAKVEINSAQVGFVKIGKPVDISIDSFPANDFGVLEGTLKSLGSDALPPDEMNQAYRFPAIVALNSQQFRLKSGQTLPLQVGMSLTANIKLRKVSYLQLLLSGFRDKAEALRRV